MNLEHAHVVDTSVGMVDHHVRLHPRPGVVKIRAVVRWHRVGCVGVLRGFVEGRRRVAVAEEECVDQLRNKVPEYRRNVSSVGTRRGRPTASVAAATQTHTSIYTVRPFILERPPNLTKIVSPDEPLRLSKLSFLRFIISRRSTHANIHTLGVISVTSMTLP